MGFVDPCRHEPLADTECYGGINGRMKEGEILWHQSLGRGEEPGSESNLLLRHKAAVGFPISVWIMTAELSFTSACTFMRQWRSG